MRAALWLLVLFAIAVAGALFAGNNQGTVTLFWPPYRIDLSLNLVVLLLAGAFFFAHAVMRALADNAYEGWIIIEAEQDPAKADPRQYAELGLATLEREARAAGLRKAA